MTVMAERVGPWTRRSRSVGYENPWIVVWHDEVTRPDGAPGVYGVVHFRNVAVGVVALDDEDRIVLVGQHRYTLDEWSWEIPEGGVPAGEDALVGARRELEEETGFRAADWHAIGRAHMSNSVADEEAILFLATGLTPGRPNPEGTEEIEVRIVSFEEALAMTLDGRITDALSMLAIQRVALERVRAVPNARS